MTSEHESGPDPKAVVRRGYDAVAARYDEAYGSETKYAALLDELCHLLPPGAAVLDLGCGGGVPVARTLAAAGHRVTGVDLSGVQVRRARERVPDAEFLRADAAEVAFARESFDAVVCLYLLIHLPLAEQPGLLRRVGGWLRPGGVLFATTGQRAWTGVEEDWLGGGAPMWWSQPDAAVSRGWIEAAGLVVEREEFVPEGTGGHPLFRARRTAARP
ncbi:class I SAM-dependent methyltransferase [Streptomyces sp. SID11385]|uniref:class I SAM-dependent methyltransferase n=1 Tax=Streptomyces sp. SID11385 TaxID=2706031 RepID=UPI0013CB753E|nr:class I SAM-dependent methyltransferase [Streptomyces sp. SID11385]NEA40666.1 class I SAM-dependent methyltransferase [Streptomyces sp. SID11385]